jgi:hypothetical protein
MLLIIKQIQNLLHFSSSLWVEEGEDTAQPPASDSRFFLSVVCGIYLFQRGGLPITPHSID